MDDILDEKLSEKPVGYVFKLRPALIWSLLLFIGIAFKFMHWPWASVLIVVNSGGLTAYSLSGMIATKGKNRLSLVLSIFGILWMLYLVGGLMFFAGLYNRTGVLVYGSVFAGYLGIYALLNGRRAKLAGPK